MAAAILDCRIRKILLADGVWTAQTRLQIRKILLAIWVEKVETHQRAKFR